MLEDKVPLWYNVKPAETPYPPDTVGIQSDMFCSNI